MGVVSDLHSYLSTQGLAGGSTGWALLRRRQMDAPSTDKQVVVYEDGGEEPEIRTTSGIGDSAMRDAGAQIMVRAGAWDGDASLAKAQAILDALHGKLNIVLGATTYLRVKARTPEPVFLGFDANGRPRHTISLMLYSQQ